MPETPAVDEEKRVHDSLAPNGFYSVERECSFCEYRTWSRDDFWQHVVEANHPALAPKAPHPEEERDG